MYYNQFAKVLWLSVIRDYPFRLACIVEVRSDKIQGVHWIKMMTSSAGLEILFIRGQDEALCPLSIDFLNFAPLCMIRHCSTTRRDFGRLDLESS